MSREVHRRRSSPAARWAATAIAGLLALSSLALVATPAAAHDELTSASPAADESVEGVPAEVRLVFSGVLSPEAGATAVDVVDGAGASIADGAPVVEENTVTQALDAASGASGAIRVLWRVVSGDGHPISGEYTFTVSAPPSPTETTTAEPTTPATSEPTPTPTASPTAAADGDDADSTFADVWLWVVLGALAAALGGALLYLAFSRVRRENALRERDPQDAGPRSDHPADH
nr:copper resistance protein CopC [Microbacterium immunditiarum]